ncbi:uncharacterized protein LOC120205664 [Hibiscus syriacus]|uniref:uncharacterized protein LOC120205664 n=1 Tax=Hibiscus syriacus TaxID=106335 RepID=UPI0019246E85|nr:uncharacterized protein LOC120205664 [Hibiscus syriacus]
MALVVYWYDFIFFGIVTAAFVGSLLVLWRKEAASRSDEEIVYESLLAARPDADGFVRATTGDHVGSNQLWTSCWIRVHPVWLVVTRFVSFAIMAGFLSWDIVEWDASIFVYYTEWTSTLVMVYFAVCKTKLTTHFPPTIFLSTIKIHGFSLSSWVLPYLFTDVGFV